MLNIFGNTPYPVVLSAHDGPASWPTCVCTYTTVGYSICVCTYTRLRGLTHLCS